MKRQTRQLLLALGLLALAGAALLLVRGLEGPEEAAAPAQPQSYIAGGEQNPLVKSLEITTGEDHFTIENGFDTAEQWRETPEKAHRISGLEEGTLNQSLLESALSDFSALVSKQVVAESGADLSEYGLDAPLATITWLPMVGWRLPVSLPVPPKVAP